MEKKAGKFLPKLMQSKDLLAYAVVAGLLILTVFFGLGKLVLAYQYSTDTKAQIESMESYLGDWKAKTDQLNHAQMRPVQANQVDNVQTDLMMHLQVYSLNLTKFAALNKDNKKEKDKTFEMDFEGPYPAVMSFLENFHSKDALISIRSLEMEPSKDIIKASISYKVYVK